MSQRVPRAPRRLIAAAALCGVLGTALSGCTGSGGTGGSGASGGSGGGEGQASPRAVRAPEPGLAFDYQIGGPYRPPAGVRAVSRDRTSKPAKGVYNICYVNAFQAQPDAGDWWQEHHPDLVLRDADGDPVVDRDWDELVLDISTRDKRARLARIVGEWIDGCAKDGFQAVEADNLDSHERSEGLLTEDDNIAFGKLITARAHAAGLAIGQKNAAELAGQGRRIGFDFAVAEECGQYDECDVYADAYDDRVFDIEYRTDGFDAACEGWGDRVSVVLRDLDVVARGESGYRRRTC